MPPCQRDAGDDRLARAGKQDQPPAPAELSICTTGTLPNASSVTGAAEPSPAASSAATTPDTRSTAARCRRSASAAAAPGRGPSPADTGPTTAAPGRDHGVAPDARRAGRSAAASSAAACRCPAPKNGTSVRAVARPVGHAADRGVPARRRDAARRHHARVAAGIPPSGQPGDLGRRSPAGGRRHHGPDRPIQQVLSAADAKRPARRNERIVTSGNRDRRADDGEQGVPGRVADRPTVIRPGVLGALHVGAPLVAIEITRPTIARATGIGFGATVWLVENPIATLVGAVPLVICRL